MTLRATRASGLLRRARSSIRAPRTFTRANSAATKKALVKISPQVITICQPTPSIRVRCLLLKSTEEGAEKCEHQRSEDGTRRGTGVVGLGQGLLCLS